LKRVQNKVLMIVLISMLSHSCTLLQPQLDAGEKMIAENFEDTVELDTNKNTFYIFNPQMAGINNGKIAIKIPYELDSYALVICITKYAKEHPKTLKKFLERNKLTFNQEDFDAVFKPSRLGYSAIKVHKKYKTKFSKTDCKGLKLLRENRELIRLAGPRIVSIQEKELEKKIGKEFFFGHFSVFTNCIEVLINPIDEQAFFKLMEKETTGNLLEYVWLPSADDTKQQYRLRYKADMGAWVNDIAKRLLGNKVILMTYPIVEQIVPYNSHGARF